jgi:hypothetical protein
VNADLAALINPAAEVAYRRQLAAEAYRAGVDDGRRDGIADTIRWYKALLSNTVADARLEQARWHVCCKPCRMRGHRDGCASCEDRNRDTYRLPHPDDLRGGTQ